MEMDFYTQVVVARIEAAQGRHRELSRLSTGLVKEGNQPDGRFIETVEMSLAFYAAEDARRALNAVYDDVRVMPDLPPQHVLEILNRRWQVTDIKEWTQEMSMLGGPKVRPGWLRDQVSQGTIFKDRPLDRKVIKAAVVMDAERPVSGVKSSLLAAA